jgi:hypothetical protein
LAETICVHSIVLQAERYFLCGLLLYPEDGGSSFLQNFGKCLSDCTVSYPSRQHVFYIHPVVIKGGWDSSVGIVAGYGPDDQGVGVRFRARAKVFSLFSLFLNKKLWEELTASFPSCDTGHIENDASNNSSIIACVFVTAETFLPSRCLATIRGFLPSRCLATIGEFYRTVA